MRDTSPYNEEISEKIWMTRDDEPYRLYEYANKASYRINSFSKIYNLRFPFQGNTHIVYNGFFYYLVKDDIKIVKFPLDSEPTFEDQLCEYEITEIKKNM